MVLGATSERTPTSARCDELMAMSNKAEPARNCGDCTCARRRWLVREQTFTGTYIFTEHSHHPFLVHVPWPSCFHVAHHPRIQASTSTSAPQRIKLCERNEADAIPGPWRCQSLSDASHQGLRKGARDPEVEASQGRSSTSSYNRANEKVLLGGS